jgi:hypothetical protein
LARTPGNPFERVFEVIRRLDRRVRKLERGQRETVTTYGERLDLEDGTGPRLRIGRQEDGSYDVVRWDRNGAQERVDWL